jgi:hypothetical protein
MDMAGMGDGGSSAPLNSSGVDFGNETAAFDFLAAILDDSTFAITGQAFATYFWYGIVAVVGLAALCNGIQVATLRLRYGIPPLTRISHPCG